jgi:hypothetical protein
VEEIMTRLRAFPLIAPILLVVSILSTRPVRGGSEEGFHFDFHFNPPPPEPHYLVDVEGCTDCRHQVFLFHGRILQKYPDLGTCLAHVTITVSPSSLETDAMGVSCGSRTLLCMTAQGFAELSQPMPIPRELWCRTEPIDSDGWSNEAFPDAGRSSGVPAAVPDRANAAQSTAGTVSLPGGGNLYDFSLSGAGVDGSPSDGVARVDPSAVSTPPRSTDRPSLESTAEAEDKPSFLDELRRSHGDLVDEALQEFEDFLAESKQLKAKVESLAEDLIGELGDLSQMDPAQAKARIEGYFLRAMTEGRLGSDLGDALADLKSMNMSPQELLGYAKAYLVAHAAARYDLKTPRGNLNLTKDGLLLMSVWLRGAGEGRAASETIDSAGVGGRAEAGLGSSAERKGAEQLPWSDWESYPKITEGGREYAQIGDRLYTQHAVERMQPSGLSGSGRSIAPAFVEQAIRTGTPTTQVVDGVTRTVYTSGSVQVVTEQGGRIVVTVNPFSGG